MGRRNRPVPAASMISEAHFRLLREYGRNELPKKISRQEQKKLWSMMCESAALPVIDREDVIDAWKAYIGGQSKFSSIAINGDIDPRYTTLGITFQGKLTAAHTTKTSTLLRRVLMIFAKTFQTREEFLNAAEKACKGIANKVFGSRT